MRSVTVTVKQVLDAVVWLRDQEGSAASLLRGGLAEMLGTAPSKEDVREYLDHHMWRGYSGTLQEHLSRGGDLSHLWYCVRFIEEPIAALGVYFNDEGRYSIPQPGVYRPYRWHLTPEEYR